MSDVTDTRCAVSRGEFAAGTCSLGFSVALSAGVSMTSGSLSDSSVSSLSSLGTAGTAGTAGAGEVGLASWTVEDEDSRCSSDRDRDCGRSVCECSDCESGRGLVSGASSKLSYTAACLLAILHSKRPRLARYYGRVMRTPSFSELCELVGLSGLSSMFTKAGCAGY